MYNIYHFVYIGIVMLNSPNLEILEHLKFLLILSILYIYSVGMWYFGRKKYFELLLINTVTEVRSPMQT